MDSILNGAQVNLDFVWFSPLPIHHHTRRAEHMTARECMLCLSEEATKTNCVAMAETLVFRLAFTCCRSVEKEVREDHLYGCEEAAKTTIV